MIKEQVDKESKRDKNGQIIIFFVVWFVVCEKVTQVSILLYCQLKIVLYSTKHRYLNGLRNKYCSFQFSIDLKDIY